MGARLNLPDGAQVEPLKVIPNDNGDVMHGLKSTESAFVSFGEAYFSKVLPGKKKGWKKHRQMILNLIVPVGEIMFVLYDDRVGSSTNGQFYTVTLSSDHYARLTVPPGIWVAFCGKGSHDNMLLNIASIPHDPAESENLPLQNDYIKYSWL